MDETERDLGGSGPLEGEMVWAPQSQHVSTSRKFATSALQPSGGPLTEQVAEVALDEAVDGAVMDHVVSPLLGEPVTTVLAMAKLLMGLVEITRGAGPTPKSMPPAAQRVWGPDAPSLDRACCRQAAQRREVCPIHFAAGPTF